MGQGSSTTDVPGVIPDRLQAHLDIFKHLATLTYTQFCDSVTELNEMLVCFVKTYGFLNM